MTDLVLEPYAVQQRWQLPDGHDAWEIVLGEYLQTLARRCVAGENCIIGHIKALALFPGNDYLRLSVVAAHIPVRLEGSVPEGCNELELTVNVIVYGLKRDVLKNISERTAAEIAHKWNGEVSNQAIHHH